MAFDEQRRQLAAAKAENDRLILEIRTKMNGVIALDPKNAEIRTVLGQELARYENRDKLVRLFVAKSGEDYFAARLDNEKAFSGFAAEFMSLLGQLEEGVGSKSLRHEERAAILKRITDMTDTWVGNKTAEWKIGGMNESKLKTQLLAIIDQTIRDLSDFSEFASTLVNEDNISPRDRATQTYEHLAGYREKIAGAYIADTDENYAILAAIREGLASVREDIPKIGTTFHMKQTLRAVDEAIEKASRAAITGRKLSPKSTLDTFGGSDNDAIAAKSADELGAAIYILRSLNMSQELFDELGAKLAPKVSPIPPKVYVPHADPEYLSFDASINEWTEMAKQAYQSGDMELAQTYLDAVDQYKEAKDDHVATEQEKAKKAMDEWRRAMAMNQRGAAHKAIIEKFKEIAKVFTGESLVSYGARATIMVDMGVSDLGELFREYVDAAMVGDVDTMDRVDGLLINIKQSYDAQRVIREQEGHVKETGVEVEEKLDEPLVRPKVADQAKLAERLGGLATAPVTETTESPVDAPAPKVKTAEEARAEIEERLRRLQG